MKKSLKWIAALCASAMLLSGSMIPAVTAADDASEEAETVQSAELYILSRLKDAIPLSNGYVYIPGHGSITQARYTELYQAFIQEYLSSIFAPSYPSITPGYPIYGTTAPSIEKVELTLDRFESTTVYYNKAYSYYSTDDSIVTVNSYGGILAVAPGEATIVVSNGLYTVVLIHVTVNEVDIEESDLTIRMSVSDTTMEIGDTATVWAYLTKYNTYPWQGGVVADLTLSVSDDSVLSLDGNVVTAVGVGSCYVTASLDDTDLSESVLVTVYEDLESIIPGAPTYPWYDTTYPWYDTTYPWYDTTYPWYDTTYPWYGSTYPWFNIEIAVPSFGSTVNIDWEAILDIDTDVYDLQSKYTYTNGSWMRTFTLIPKDGTAVAAYDTEYRRVYVTGGWEVVAILTPSGYTAGDTKKEEVKVDPVLTPEEIEALEKAEAEAKKQAELKKKIAQAMEGKLAWYEVYGDLYGDSYYTNAVKYALENLYVTGNEDGTFGSADAVTYGDVADVLCKFLTMTPEEMEKSGIIDAEDADKEITREEMAVVLQKVAQKMGLNTTASVDLTGFADYKDLDSDKADAFGWALRYKLLNKNGEEIQPEGAVDKARLCQMLYILDNLAK